MSLVFATAVDKSTAFTVLNLVPICTTLTRVYLPWVYCARPRNGNKMRPSPLHRGRTNRFAVAADTPRVSRIQVFGREVRPNGNHAFPTLPRHLRSPSFFICAPN